MVGALVSEGARATSQDPHYKLLIFDRYILIRYTLYLYFRH